MEVDGQTNPAYEDDSCDSLDSLSLSSETESLELENLRPKDDPQINLPATSTEIPVPDRFVMLFCSEHGKDYILNKCREVEIDDEH